MVMTITVVVGTLVIEDDKVNFVKGAQEVDGDNVGNAFVEVAWSIVKRNNGNGVG